MRHALSLVLAFMLLLSACSSSAADQDTSTSTTEDGSGSDDPGGATSTTTSGSGTFEPGSAGTYQGIPAGFTEEGYPYLGDPEAPVSLIEFSDFLCPFCGRHYTQTIPALLDEYVKTGKVEYVFRDFPLDGLHPTAPAGHAAALCVAEQGAELFWAMHDQLFQTQQAWASLPDNSAYLAGMAEGVGADMNTFQTCLDSGRMSVLVAQSVAEGFGLGFNGTPSFQIVDNRSEEIYELIGAQPMTVFQDYLDGVLSGEGPPVDEEPEAETSELPFWAAAGLAPDPDRPGYNLAGDPYKGDPDAPMVVIEFSDFQCPSCRTHALETEPAVDEALVDTGRVMWVFKNYPLVRVHPQAAAAAAAAECAGRQGDFWGMYHALFEDVEVWSVDPPDAELAALATGLGLDGDAFSACLGGRAALENVLSDYFEVQGTVSETPTFVIIRGDRGSITRGSRPADEFIRLLEGLLDNQSSSG